MSASAQVRPRRVGFVQASVVLDTIGDTYGARSLDALVPGGTSGAGHYELAAGLPP